MPAVKIQINQNEKERNAILNSLKENHYYCPCKVDKTPDTKCRCKEFRDQESGWCECGLYEKIVMTSEE